MQINLQKTAIVNFLDLINFDNSTSLTEAEVSIGVPAAWDDGNGGVDNDRNSIVTLSAVADSGYAGTVDIRYYRLDVDTIATNGAITLERTLTESSTVETALSALVTQLGVLPEEVELTDELGAALTELPAIAEGQTATVYVTAATDSLTYSGTVAATLSPYVNPDQPMSETVTTTDASGFDY
jgi:hypothetical protein